MTWICRDKSGKEIKAGDEVETFRGESVKVWSLYPPGSSGGGMNGKVLVIDKGHQRLYNISVIGGRFIQEENVVESGLAEDPLEAPKTSPKFRRAMAEEKGYDD